MKKGSSGIAKICAHDIEWWYEYNPDLPDIEELPESEEEHIKHQLCNGIVQGELCHFDNEHDQVYYGWWKIQNK